ncbi:uncharacterized protein UTRI_10496 [Ustilago trichophora]|uniref:Complex 1 LYR protein domain-containing protein n=1 Tax=Ustilago trichophora TaxID=86804 RepID=A0A5C3EDZ5_9BASI|nr:uncharacterized protein UTRI_10496 [Ustilago trichophora]
MPPLGHPLRARAIGLYKEAMQIPDIFHFNERALHRLGREYPDPKYNFLGKLRSMFAKNAHLTDEKEIKAKLDLAEFIKKETETLYSLKKYRTMRRRYVQD